MNDAEQPTYIRQRYLLAFISGLRDRGIYKTALQKLVFLGRQYTGAQYYDFMPYKFGPYSFQMERDIDSLCRDGFLQVISSRIHVKKTITFPVELPDVLERGKALLRRVYREYPYYAVNSTIIMNLFPQEEAEEILRQGKSPNDSSKDILFTIGYEGRTLESFIKTLIDNGIKLLCDVRKNPISRKPGFSAKTLKHILNHVHIKYTSITGLGIESEKRADLAAIEDYDELFADYRTSIDDRTQYIRRVYRLFREHHRIALMCYEKNPAMCHRNVIREKLIELYGMEGMNL